MAGVANKVGLVAIAKAAELLTEAGDPVSRAGLSQYCRDHGLKGEKSGRAVLVDFEEVQEHRRLNFTREVMSGRKVEAVAPPAPVAEVVQIPPKDDPQRGLKQVQLRQALREEAIAEGRLAEIAEVDAGAAEAVAELRAAFVAARAQIAEELAAELGLAPDKVRVLRAGLKRYDRVGQERFATRMGRALATGNETTGEAVARLKELTAHSVRIRAKGQTARFAVG